MKIRRDAYSKGSQWFPLYVPTIKGIREALEALDLRGDAAWISEVIVFNSAEGDVEGYVQPDPLDEDEEEIFWKLSDDVRDVD